MHTQDKNTTRIDDAIPASRRSEDELPRRRISMSLLGIEVDAITQAELTAEIARIIERGERRIIANHNLHSVYLNARHRPMQVFYRKAHRIHVDGMPLVFLGKLFRQPIGLEHRVAYLDWVAPLMQRAVDQKWRVFYLGSRPGVAEKGAATLRESFPGLNVVTSHGYFDCRQSSSENQAVLSQIAACRPHVLMVGMGMPRQEQWIIENLESIRANAILNCGACIDYLAGELRTPPRWLGKLGLEWAYRLCCEPRRLGQRYLVEPWLLLGILAYRLLARVARVKSQPGANAPE
jgi:N-acetylglucosaminyldiphosphoundecaprenol N-acetyl-beta-D-mannosaminyltransferase